MFLLGNITIFLTLLSNFKNILTGRLIKSIFYKRRLHNVTLYLRDKFLYETENNTKELISISPGGFKGFYMLGITSYIKKHYDVSNFIFSGASAGAWNALLMTYKGDTEEFIEKIFEMKDVFSRKDLSLFDLENLLKNKLLKLSRDDDYDFSRLYIGVSTFNRCKFKINIFSNFKNLEDAIDCCISSSHIPLVTGGILKRYNNMYVFDGGFSKYPYVQYIEPKLHITPNIWNKSAKTSLYDITSYTTLLSKGKFDVYKLYLDGYADSEKNKHILDNIFLNKKI